MSDQRGQSLGAYEPSTGECSTGEPSTGKPGGAGRGTVGRDTEKRIVEARGLGKRYRVYASPWDRLWEALFRRRRHRDFHALEGVEIELRRGEGLAIIGENGAGKSTLLKILAGITAPSAGSLSVRGKVASILELGSGFHPEFTGRQNIVLNAAMLGLSEAEVEERMPEIIAFSELGDFIEQPVKCYSTGMAMRLGFSIATQVDPEVLIIDEALSVGDGYFQKKCMDRLQQFVEAGGTLLFCSHAMYYVSAFCQRALWLKEGHVERLGPVEDVVREYENYLVAKRAASVEEQQARARSAHAEGETAGAAAAETGGEPRAAVREARIVSVTPPEEPGTVAAARCGEPLAITVEWETDDPALAFHLGVSINRNDGLEVATFSTRHDGLAPFCGQRRYRAELELPALPLVKGEFGLHVFVADEQALYVFDHHLQSPAFQVASAGYRFGLVQAEHRWRLPDRVAGPRAVSAGGA